MTASAPIPTLPLELNVGDPGAAEALIRLHAAGVLVLTAGELATIRRADTLGRALRRAGDEMTAHENEVPAVRQRAIAELARQAAVGSIDAAAIDPYLAHLAAVPLNKQRYDVIREAADAAARSTTESVKAWVRGPALQARLVAALDLMLDAADAHARVMAEATGFAYSDPAAVYRADRPVQTAFGALVPIADRHDLLRRSVVALWGQYRAIDNAPPAMPPQLQGAGVVLVPNQSGGPKVWRYQPDGHPVQRLVAAVAARDEAADSADAA